LGGNLRESFYTLKGSNPQDLLSKLIKRVESSKSIHLYSEAEILGFEKKNGYWVPYVWHIRNVYRLGRFSYLDYRKNFTHHEEFWTKFPDTDPSEIKNVLKVMAKQFNPFWFHQGIDLVTFNVLQSSIKAAFKHLCENHPDHNIPTTLEEWEKHVKMQILMYSSYYQSFYPTSGQYVGGGTDILSLEWPK